jgi:hypothetical protein
MSTALPAEAVSPPSPSAPVPLAIDTDSARQLVDVGRFHVETPTHSVAPENPRPATKESGAVTRLPFATEPALANQARARLAAMLGTHSPAADREAVDVFRSVAVSPKPDAENQQTGDDQSLDVHLSVRESVDPTGALNGHQAINDGAVPVLPFLRPLLAQTTDRLVPQEVPMVRRGRDATGGDTGPSSILQFDAAAQKSFFTEILNATHATSPSSAPRVMLPNETATTHAIVQTLRLQAASGGGTAVVTLAPEYLGSVTVSLRVTDGGVVATLHAENASVRTWMESNVSLLKDGLAQQGLTLEQLVVADMSEPGRPADDQTDRQTEERTPARRRRRREQSTFEVVV